MSQTPKQKGCLSPGLLCLTQGIEHPDECCLGSQVISKAPAQHTLATGLYLHTQQTQLSLASQEDNLETELGW